MCKNFQKVPSLNPLTALPFFFPNGFPTHYAYIYAQCQEGFQLIMHIFMHTFHYLMFSLWHCKLHMQFWQGGARLRWSPLQHPSVQLAHGKLHLVGEESPFDSEFTTRGLLTQMQSMTPSKSAEGDFFMQFWQGGARLRWSPLQHPSVQLAHGKLHLVGEESPFDSEFTARGSLIRMQSGTPLKSAEGDFFRGGYCSLFEKHTCLRTMECLHCKLKAFSDCAYIYA